jgi:glycosyltransferase involved in cell wall biosynthesis
MEKVPKKKKVLFVITKSNFGGAQKYVYDLAISLPKDRFEAVVALGGSGILAQKLTEQHIRVISISSLKRDVNIASDFSVFFRLRSIFLSEKPDVVHLNSAKAGGVGALAARLAGVPKIIFTAHGWAFNEDRPLPQRLIIKFLSWAIIFLSDKTIAVSDAVKNSTRNWPFTGEKIVVIKNGIIKPKFYSAEEARAKLSIQAKMALPPNAFVVGTIAELHKSKGLQYSIRAFANLASKESSFYYFIIGDGDEKKCLNDLIELYKLKERVFLLGFIEDASRFLPAFDMFTLPSITEAFGLVLLEAGFAKLPVVAAQVGGIPEIIEDKKTGILVPSRNSDAITLAIENLSKSAELRMKLGTALQEKIFKNFSIDNVIFETTKIYSEK